MIDPHGLIIFNTWSELQAHIAAGLPLWYQAPMDYRPVHIEAVLLPRTGNIRVFPPTDDADPFVADVDHLPRFRRINL